MPEPLPPGETYGEPVCRVTDPDRFMMCTLTAGHDGPHGWEPFPFDPHEEVEWHGVRLLPYMPPTPGPTSSFLISFGEDDDGEPTLHDVVRVDH